MLPVTIRGKGTHGELSDGDVHVRLNRQLPRRLEDGQARRHRTATACAHDIASPSAGILRLNWSRLNIAPEFAVDNLTKPSLTKCALKLAQPTKSWEVPDSATKNAALNLFRRAGQCLPTKTRVRRGWGWTTRVGGARKISTRQRGLLNASWTAAKRFGA